MAQSYSGTLHSAGEFSAMCCKGGGREGVIGAGKGRLGMDLALGGVRSEVAAIS